MKILILANNDVGLYQFRKELIAELLKEHSVYISLPYGELVDPLVEMGCIFIDTPLDRRGVNPATDSKLFKKYLSILKTVKPDLVITYTIKPNVYGGFACRLKKIPYAVNITGLGTAFQKKGVLRTLVTIMYKAGLKKAKVVFFENSGNRSIFLQNHIVRKKQCCLLNGAGVNLEHYSLLPYPEDDEETRFLFIGRVMQEKGIDELFAAMRKLIADGYRCSLDVLGGYEENYKDLIGQYEKEGWLRYHGYQKDVRPFIQNAHCFVLPSWHEGMANTNLECAASGRPVITSNIHGCMEAVIENETGYLCKSVNTNSLYEVMQKFTVLSSESRRKMGIAGRKHMETIFDKRKVVNKTINNLFKQRKTND